DGTAQVEALRDGGDLLFAQRIAEFVIPVEAAHAVHRRVPKRTGRRFQIGQHMRPAVALDGEDAGRQPRVHATLRRSVIVNGLTVDFVHNALAPGADDPTGLAVHVARI